MSILVAATLSLAMPTGFATMLVSSDWGTSQEKRDARDPDKDEAEDRKDRRAKPKRPEAENRTSDCRRDALSGRCSLYNSPFLAS